MFDRDAAVDKAVLVFRRHGYQAASIDLLSRGTGLAVGSLYKAFKDKKDIFAVAFSCYVEERRDALAARLSGVETARARIAALLEFYLDAASGPEGRLGCLVVGTLVESPCLDEKQRAVLSTAIEVNEKHIRALLREGLSDGSIRADLDIGQAAAVLLALLQGIRALGKLREPAEHAGFIAAALRIID